MCLEYIIAADVLVDIQHTVLLASVYAVLTYSNSLLKEKMFMYITMHIEDSEILGNNFNARAAARRAFIVSGNSEKLGEERCVTISGHVPVTNS